MQRIFRFIFWLMLCVGIIWLAFAALHVLTYIVALPLLLFFDTSVAFWAASVLVAVSCGVYAFGVALWAMGASMSVAEAVFPN